MSCDGGRTLVLVSLVTVRRTSLPKEALSAVAPYIPHIPTGSRRARLGPTNAAVSLALQVIDLP